MKTVTPIVFFIMAIVCLYWSLVAKTYRAGGPGRTATGKPLPKWFGRLWFVGFGVILLYLAIRALR